MADEADDEEILDSSLVLKQYVSDVLDFSSHYGGDSSLSYTAYNLIGKPSVYPHYGDYADTFLVRTFGPWWRKAPSFCKPFKQPHQSFFYSQDFIDLKFENEVYPISIDIYETYNPGSVVRILAFDSGKCRWEVIWHGLPIQDVTMDCRIFSPPITTTTFPTSIIRLELCHYYLEYYAEFDCVLLTGAKESLFSNNNLKSVYEKLHKKLLIQPSSKTTENCKDNDNFTPDCFEKLPHEVINLILSYLDLPSLCKAACINKLFYCHCYDSLLYTELDLQVCWEKISQQSLMGLASRCANLVKLNLSWCGNYDRINPQAFINFIECCGSQLTHLRLSNCQFINNECLRVIAIVCTNLNELDIPSCRKKWLDQTGFQEIAHLKNLTRLNLYRTMIDSESIISIIRSCTNLLHLNLGNCAAISNFDDVAIELGNNCKNLKSLDMWRAKTLTSIGIVAIARNCFLLEELDIGWCSELLTTNGCLIELTRNCPLLKKLFLTAIRTVSDVDLGALSWYCPQLEQLDILGTREISPLAVFRALQDLKKLQYIDVSFCAQITTEIVRCWRECFPHISIRKSFQMVLANVAA